MSAWDLSVYGEWLVVEAEGCTCQGSDAHYGHQPGCGYEPAATLVDVKAALEAAGFAVVELPQPDETVEATDDEHGVKQWWVTGGVVAAFDSGTVEFDIPSVHGEDMSLVRSYAAALLAAAAEVPDA